MNQAAEAFLQDVWHQITEIYERENRRIGELPKPRSLQAYMKDYLRVAWRKPKGGGGYGRIHVDVFEPFEWSDDAYKSGKLLRSRADGRGSCGRGFPCFH